MELKRKEEIKNEAKRRLNLWIENSSIDEMTCGGSRLRFDMALGLIGGYPFKKKPWMVGFNGFITEEEFDSSDYDEIIDELFNNK